MPQKTKLQFRFQTIPTRHVSIIFAFLLFSIITSLFIHPRLYVLQPFLLRPDVTFYIIHFHIISRLH